MRTELSGWHEAGLPWCYYDLRREKVALRFKSSPGVLGVSALFGDPYDYDRTGDAPLWRYGEAPMGLQYAGGDTLVWRVELERPRWNRLMYSFLVKTAGGDRYYSPRGFLPPEPRFPHDYYDHFFYPFIHEADAPGCPSWAAETVWYQVFPERFCRGDPSFSPPGTASWETGDPARRNFFGGDLRGLRGKLPYLRDLGINGLYLTPVFEAPSNHKYDIEDYYAVDRHFGNLEDLRGLVAEAHSLGIRVMLDAVFNHAGKTHPFWRDLLEKQEASAYRDYFHIHGFPVKEHYRDYREMNFDSFAFAASMPKWNTENPEAREYLIGAALYWIRECDIDAWRLDVANEVSFDFWKEFSRRVHGAKKDFYLLGEVWYDAGRWVNPGYFDAVMNYPLGFAVGSYFLERTMGPREFTESLFAALSRYSDLHTALAFNLLDSHDTARALTRAGGDKQALRSAFTMLFLLPGSPCVYYGTEAGMEGGGDPQNRRPMLWDEKRRDRELFAFFQKLAALRREYLGLIQGASIAYRPLGGAQCWTLSPRAGGQGALSIVHAGPEPFRPGPEFGRRVFSSAPPSPSGEAAGGEVPPGAVSVFFSGR
jgi:glycosidase